MREVITLEKFREIIGQMKELIQAGDQFFDNEDYNTESINTLKKYGMSELYSPEKFLNSNLTNTYEYYEDYIYEYLYKEFTRIYTNLQNQLISYDLSDIPFEEWKEVTFIIDDKLDLSETKGNFDFKQIELLENVLSTTETPVLIIKGCNVKNLKNINLEKNEDYYVNRISIQKDNFDEKIIEENKEAFFMDDLTDNLKRLVNKNKSFSLYSLEQLKGLNKEDIEIMRNHPFFDIIINKGNKLNFKTGLDAFFYEGKGKNIFYDLLEEDYDFLEYIIKEYSHHPDFYEKIENSNSTSDFLNKISEEISINNDLEEYLLYSNNEKESMYRKHALDKIAKFRNIPYFNKINELFTNLPEELLEKINNLSLKIEDFAMYPELLKDPIFIFYSDDELLYKAMKSNDLFDFDIDKIYIKWDTFIKRCVLIDELKENKELIETIKEKNYYSYTKDVLTTEEILLSDDLRSKEAYIIPIELSKKLIKYIDENIIEDSNLRLKYIKLINSFISDITIGNNNRINPEFTDTIIKFIDICGKTNFNNSALSKILCSSILNGSINEVVGNNLDKKIEFISSMNDIYNLELSFNYQFHYFFVENIFKNFDINNEQDKNNYITLMNIIKTLSQFSNLKTSTDFYIENRLIKENLLGVEELKKDTIFMKFINEISDKLENADPILIGIINKYIEEDISSANYINDNRMDKYNNTFDIFSKMQYSSKQSELIDFYFKTRFSEELEKDELKMHDQRFILTINLLNEKFKEISNNTISIVNKYIEDKISSKEFYGEDFDKKIDYLIELCIRTDYSNSSEIRKLSSSLVDELLKFPKEEAFKKFDLIEDIFVKNNLPYFSKLYNVFEILHPEIPTGQSPNLNTRENITSKKIILFSDLLKISINSNDKNLIEYINNIKRGNEILKSLIAGNITLDDLDNDDMSKNKEIFTIFVNHLNTLYNNTKAGRETPRKMKNHLLKDACELLSLFLKNEEKEFNVDELPDRIVKMFGHFAGINSIEQLDELIKERLKETEERNEKNSLNGLATLKKGDLIKGIGDIRYFKEILQHGSLCKEFLGSSADSDSTPMDNDVSIISEDCTIKDGLFGNKELNLRRVAASGYGPIYLILKNDERERWINSDENPKYNKNKMELFYTGLCGSDHYGIRTGFGSTDIDYFVVDDTYNNLEEMKLYISMNGFYIPIVDVNTGEVIFTIEEFNKFRNKMQGLSYYGEGDNYKFAKELDDFNVEDYNFDINIGDNITVTTQKRNLVINALSSAGLNISSKRQYNMSNGVFELLDTGSTGRGSNSAKDYDFDFIMRIDREVYQDENKYTDFQNKIIEALPGISFLNKYTIRNQHVNLGGEDVKIDITIIIKDDKIDYSTDECIKDRLDNIRKIDLEKHQKVLENIVLAKEILKEAECYKPDRGDVPQGGLGGVGVENWILQHGGSFEVAARDFVEKAEGKDFSEFKESYSIWDFGENHLYFKHGGSKHDNFVKNNMSKEGYDKMLEALKKYLKLVDENRKIKASNKQF